MAIPRRGADMKPLSLLTLAALFVALSCAKTPSGPMQALDSVKELFAAQKYAEAATHFTPGTRGALQELERVSPGARDAGYGFAALFAEGSEWEVVESDVKGDAATVKVRYTRHPVENYKGNEIAFRLKSEGGAWKLDMQSEVEAAVRESGAAK